MSPSKPFPDGAGLGIGCNGWGGVGGPNATGLGSCGAPPGIFLCCDTFRTL
jgi:hypothetical protein